MEHLSASQPPFATPLIATPAESIRSRRLNSAFTDGTTGKNLVGVGWRSTLSAGLTLDAATTTISRPRRRFKSSRLIGEFEKPWLHDRKRQINWDSIIFYTCVGIAFGTRSSQAQYEVKGLRSQ